MRKFLWFEFGRRRLEGRARKSGGLKRSGSDGGMTVMEDSKNLLGALIENFGKVCYLFTMVPSLCVLKRDEVLSNVGQSVSVLFQLFQPVVDAVLGCCRILSDKEIQ